MTESVPQIRTGVYVEVLLAYSLKMAVKQAAPVDLKEFHARIGKPTLENNLIEGRSPRRGC